MQILKPETPAIADVPVSAVASSDGKLVRLDLQTVQLKSSMSALNRSLVLGGHGGPVNGLAFSTDGSKLATGSADKQPRCSTSQMVPNCVSDDTGSCQRRAFAVEGTLLVTANEDNKLRTWPVAVRSA